jgi:glycosyltransferase involved in cell wall biosynthesis
MMPTFWPRQGGGQMVIAAIAQGLAPDIETIVLSRRFRDTPPEERYEHLTVRRYGNPAPERWKDYATGARAVSFPQKLVVTGLDIVCSLGPLSRLVSWSDLVHVHFPLPLGLSTLAVRAFVRRPLVVTVHGNADVYELPQALAPVTRAVLTRADAVVSVSHDLAQYLERRMGLANVTVIPNGVDVDLFRPVDGSRSAFTLFSICRLVPRKNVHVLVEAVRRLAAEGADLRLVVAGTGPEQDRIARLARESGGVVEFVGFVDEAGKRARLAGTDVFVQLSMREGLSIATLEALACGVPCLVSDIPGVREPVTPGRTGWYVTDPENVQSVVDALRTVLAARPALADMKRTCREVAVERYSLARMCESYWTLYAELLGRRA